MRSPSDIPAVDAPGRPGAEDPAVDELRQLLDAEREAALRADVEGLVALQESKRLALERLAGTKLAAAVADPMGRRARSNLALMRHLVDCLRGVTGTQHNGTYSPDGALAPRPGRSRGTL